MMRKNKLFRKEQLKFMLLNLVAFSVIFTIFDFIIFHEVQRTLFSKADRELESFQEMITDQTFPRIDLPMRGKEPNRNLLPEGRPNTNPRIIVLKWDNQGVIANEDEIGTLLYENYFQTYKLDLKNLDVLTTTTIDDEYHFRTIVFQNPLDGSAAYTELLINIDAEYTIIDNFAELLLLCSILFILLSITASYLLSKKMMNPIIRSWNKQAEFVENASHELRTPLTIVQNKLEALLVEPEEKILNKFEHIALGLSETRRLSKLTSDLLTLARADSSETELMKQSVKIDDLILDVCSPFMDIADSQDKYFSFQLQSEATIEADEARLHQLLVILFDNALKYTSSQDKIHVRTYREESKVIIEVSDTGIGIKPDNIQHIFDRFYREDKARSRETGGTGLGLSIAQWIVEKHGGTISVLQNQPRGTTFKIKIPK
ncbi:cell wall metabolism sensor histidine kinase WalK [Sporosarcina sp. NCCP-2222]|uniref:sensor histidine kinase n=1 Tax=Sporosarcina sp. NCCP-2222 TaxID=2935073 RepID=UPI0020BF4DCA|nr:ATP-binding protein [Sporosarcina sp. NCCP-2222]